MLLDILLKPWYIFVVFFRENNLFEIGIFVANVFTTFLNSSVVALIVN